MQLKQKFYLLLFFLFLIFTIQIIPQEKLSIKGKICIDGLQKEKQYAASLFISKTEIHIVCKKSIFQLFNEFDTPPKKSIKITISELLKISVDVDQIIFCFKKNSYTLRAYPNIFKKFEELVSFNFISPNYLHFQAIKFIPDSFGKKEQLYVIEYSKSIKE